MVAQKYNKIFFAYLSPEQNRWLRKEAKRLDISISAVIREIVEMRIAEIEEEMDLKKLVQEKVTKLKGEQKR